MEVADDSCFVMKSTVPHLYSIFPGTDSAENKNSTSETSSVEPHSGQRRTAPAPGAGIPANPFDFSAMTGLLNVFYLSNDP